MTTLRPEPTHRLTRVIAMAWCVLAAMLFAAPRASAQVAAMPPQMAEVGVTEHLDQPLPLDAQLRDHTGAPVRLGSLFDGKRPVVLTFAYHTCPVVCSMIAHNVANGLKEIGWTLGEQYTAITISINPHESLEKTALKRQSVLSAYGRSNNGWNFLVADEATIARVADAAGFRFQYDKERGEWAHSSVAMIVKPNGRMARYLYGFDFPPNDLKLGLLEASEGRHITTIEQIILYCYHYEPKGGKYVLVAMRVMQVGGGSVAALLFSVLGIVWTRELRKRPKDSTNEDDSEGGRG